MRALLVPMLLLAGCLAPSAPDAADITAEDGWRFTQWDGEAFVPTERPVVEVGRPVRYEGVCAGACVLRAEVAPPDEEAWVEVLARWDGTRTTFAMDEAQRGFDSLRWLAPSAPTVEATLEGQGPVTGRLALLGPDVSALEGVRRLPNIVTYVPEQLHVGDCDPVEQREQGATRCLRLGNAIGNTGDGPLQVVLPPQEGVLTAAGLGAFDQRVLLRGGGHEDHRVGNADLHLSHAHFHYDGFARFTLHHFDEGTGLRGEPAAEHKKSGFCFLDWGKMEGPDRRPQERDRADADCLLPGPQGWSMGVTAGWFDFYWAGLTDQYVDIAGVPDGVYELVSTADWSDSLLETGEADNGASAVLRLEGDSVEVLEERSFYTLPRDTQGL